MTTEFGRIDFMFLAPPHPAAGSATAYYLYLCVISEMYMGKKLNAKDLSSVTETNHGI